MIEKYLEEIGLSKKESAIYTSLLSFDKASVLDISKKANVKRPTTYVILVSLMKKGLVNEISINKKTYYTPEPPEKLEVYITKQIEVLETNKSRLSLVIPLLKEMVKISAGNH